MRALPAPQSLQPMLAHDKLLLPGELERLLGARPASARPGTLREAIVRWLNAEL